MGIQFFFQYLVIVDNHLLTRIILFINYNQFKYNLYSHAFECVEIPSARPYQIACDNRFL